MNVNQELIKNKEYIIKEYYSGTKAEVLSDKFQCTKPTIYKFLQRNGVEKRSRRRYRIKYNLNEKYFENIDCQEKSYWLGFLMADGNIFLGKGNKKYLRLELSAKDLSHLQNFLKCINSDVPIKYRYKKNTYYISISNQKICNDLINLNCIPRKTFNLKFPKLKKYLIPHFVRGYFDGDGCISKRKNKNSYTCFFLGQPFFLEELNSYLYQIGIDKKIKRHSKSNVFKINIYKKSEIDSLYVWMYSEMNICLYRKYNKFIERIKS